jgi:hypothetical protein
MEGAMIRYETSPSSPVVEIAVSGRLTDLELRETIKRLKADMELNGKTRVLESIADFTGMEPAAVWTDITLGPPLVRKITRAAVVADAGWIRGLTTLSSIFVKADIKSFRPDQIAEARAWLSAA